MNKIWILIATFFGIGFLPIAPGTWASLVTALVFFFSPLSTLSSFHWLLIAAVIFAIGVPAAAACEKRFQKKDPGQCVIDEVVGQIVGFLLLPRLAGFYIAAFFLFRFFDILKPFPIRKSESLPHGFGIMSDDVLAGLYTLGILLAVQRVFFA
jgi:phosphatidylglycerophosphatase A